MPFWKNYLSPTTVEQAVSQLAHSAGNAVVLAGGTDLLLDFEQGRHPPVEQVVDISRIPEMRRLEIRDGQIFIGAGVPHSQIAASPLIQTHARALSTACGLIGGPQVRNIATLGGNVAHALPAADGTIALLCLDALAEVASPSGREQTALPALFAGPGKSNLQPDQLLAGFWLPVRGAGESSTFQRIMRPQGTALPILNMAVWLRREDALMQQVRLVVGPAGPKPVRASQTEAFLCGKPPSAEHLRQAVEILLGESSFRTSPHRASQSYRQELAAYLLEKIVLEAFAGAEDA